jgi:hypothetical protein
MTATHRPLGDERGSVIVMFALLLPVLLLTLALAVDVGNWFVHKRHLQTQADAAALAGGAFFGDCFSPDAGVASAANATIQSNALSYAGNASSAYNLQVGGGAARVTTLFNSKTFAAGGPPADDTETGGPCQTPHLMFDVKQTEADVPYILGGLIDWVSGTVSSHVVPAVNARARVQLKKASIVSGSLPLAVPDVVPKHVTATFVNEATGAIIGAPLELAPSGSGAGLNYWEGSGSVAVPADANVGVRIGLGGLSATCAPADKTGGVGFTCYDYADYSIGLVAIRGVGSGGTLTAPKPKVWATTSCASTGSPFFSERDVAAGVTTCSASVQAVMQTGGAAIDASKILLFNAVLNDGKTLKNFTVPLTSAGAYWSTGYAIPVPVANGPVKVSLEWRYQGGSKQTYTNVQRVYSAVEGTTANDSGPVKALSLQSSAGTVGAPYTLSAGSQPITVRVGIKGSLDLSTPTQTTVLRLTGGSRTSAIRCDGGSGTSDFQNSVENGCSDPYQINTAGYCPDPVPVDGPADCVDTESGDFGVPTAKAMDARFADCPPNNWPDYELDDPRIVKLMITDFSALDGSGKTEVPIINFGAFYITGWQGQAKAQACADNEPAPPNTSTGDIWGHFIKHVAPDPFSGGTEVCDPLSVTPCIPVLVK